MFFGSIVRGLSAERENFGIGEDAWRLFGGVKDARDGGLVSGNAVLLQPEQHVGLSAHRADLDYLVEAEKMRGHATVDGVGKLEIIFSKCFDERGGVNSRCGAKRVMADDGIVQRNRCVGSLSHFLAILLEPREILLHEAHEAKIDKHQFHGRIANAFTEGVGGGMDLVGTGSDSRKRIGDGKAAVIMTMPIDTNFLAGRFHDFFDGKLNKVERTVGSCVTDRVAEDDSTGAISN